MTAAQRRLSLLNLASIAAMLAPPPPEESAPALLELQSRRPAPSVELARSMGLSRTRPFAAAVVLPGECTGCASPDCKHHGARARKLARRAARRTP